MGVILGATMIWHPDIAIKELAADGTWTAVRSTATTIPIHQGQPLRLRLAVVLDCGGRDAIRLDCFHPLVILIVTAVSNGANLTDGIDGLATGTSAIIGMALAGARLRRFQHGHRGLPQHHVHPWL